MYLTALMDVYSRKIITYSLSTTMSARWCADLVQEGINLHGKPEIINTDQGVQYTSEIFTQTVLDNGIKLSMDGKGRATDNAFIERLWRSVKYEKLYLLRPQSPQQAYQYIADYVQYYNEERRHSSLEDGMGVSSM